MSEINIVNPLNKKGSLVLKSKPNNNSSNTGNLSKMPNNDFKSINKTGFNGIAKLKSSEELRDYSKNIDYNCFKNSNGKTLVEKGKVIFI